jgi:hypothetical protein
MTFERELIQQLVVALERVPESETFEKRTEFLLGVNLNVGRNQNNRRSDLLVILRGIDAADPASALRVIDNAMFSAGEGAVEAELKRLRAEVEGVLVKRNSVGAQLTGTLAAPLEKVVTSLGIQDLGRWMARLQAIQGQVAYLTVRNEPRGTAFLVGPDVALTNYHVLEDVIAKTTPADQVELRFDYSRDGAGVVQTTVNVKLANEWLLAHAPWSNADFSADIRTLPDAGELDYALVRLARRVGDETRGGSPRRWVELPATPAALTPGMQLFILQHPQGLPLQVALDKVEAVNSNGTRARYLTNTQGGASGSPCLDQDWNLVALHHSSDPREGVKAQYNQGVPIATIRAHLAAAGKLSLLGG